MMDVILANKLDQGDPRRSASAAGRRRRPAPLGRRRRSPARPARRRAHPPGAPDPDLPPSPTVGHRRQRPPHQPRPAPAAHRASATSTGSPATPPRTPACTRPRRPRNSSVDIVARRIPAKFGLDPIRDVQVLTPMHRGPAGAGALNALLQDALTPQRDGTLEKRYGDRVFRVGDKVIQLRNNYTKGKAGIFNGTVATVTGLSLQEQTLTVLTDEDEHDRLRLRRTRRTRPRLRDHRPPLPRQRIPRRGDPAHHLLLDDAATQPALHRRHPRQATHRPRRIPPCTRPSRPHPRSRTPPHRTHPPTPTRRIDGISVAWAERQARSVSSACPRDPGHVHAAHPDRAGECRFRKPVSAAAATDPRPPRLLWASGTHES